MALKAFRILTVTSAIALAAAGCGSGSPAQPSSVIGGSTGTSFAAAHPITPLDRATVPFASQPVVMAVSNGVATSGAAVTYTFEVATDAGFTNIVFKKDGVVAEPGAVTHQTITATLPGAITYYWHARTNSGGSLGPYSPAVSFALGPQVTLGVPVPVSPAQGATAEATGLKLIVNNVSHSGPVGTLSYRFEVADSSSFSHVVFSSATNEQAGGKTSITVSTTLTPGVGYFWRVTATDPPSGVSSQTSLAVSFKVTTFNPATAIVVHSPPSLMSWDVTAKITSVQFSDDAFQVDFDRRDSPDRWPDLEFAPGSDGTLQYTLGMCEHPHRRSVVLLGGRAVLVWARAHRVDAPVLHRAELVLRAAVGRVARVSARGRRNRRPVRRHGQPSRQNRRLVPADMRAVERPARDMAERRRPAIHVRIGVPPSLPPVSDRAAIALLRRPNERDKNYRRLVRARRRRVAHSSLHHHQFVAARGHGPRGDLRAAVPGLGGARRVRHARRAPSGGRRTLARGARAGRTPWRRRPRCGYGPSRSSHGLGISFHSCCSSPGRCAG